MTQYNQLADGSTPDTSDSKFDQFLADVPEAKYDLNSIFPGAGTYAVTGMKGFGYYDENDVPKTARVLLRIDKVASDDNSKLVGRDFSIFFSMNTSKSDDADPPISFSERRLHFLMTDEYPKAVKGDSRRCAQWVKEVASGMHFILVRTIKRDKNGQLRENDKLMSFAAYTKLNGDLSSVPEESPEQAVEGVTL
jgi:hypothetical protein